MQSEPLNSGPNSAKRLEVLLLPLNLMLVQHRHCWYWRFPLEMDLWNSKLFTLKAVSHLYSSHGLLCLFHPYSFVRRLGRHNLRWAQVLERKKGRKTAGKIMLSFSRYWNSAKAPSQGKITGPIREHDEQWRFSSKANGKDESGP